MGEPDFLTRTRDGYDRTVAADAERFHRHLDSKPVDPAVIAGFAGLVSTTGNLRVADLRCGTGTTTAMLCDLGVDAFGGASACLRAWWSTREGNPDIHFDVGSMTSPGRSCGRLRVQRSVRRTRR